MYPPLDLIALAKSYGRNAHFDGTQRVWTDDIQFVEFVARNAKSNARKKTLIEAWTRGWDQAAYLKHIK
jgi:hypothetical protein